MNGNAGREAGETGPEEGVILFGDSIFFGVGAATRQAGCARLLQEWLDMPVGVRSRPGTDSDYGAANLADKVLANPRRNILVMFGNNDCRIADDGVPCVDKKRFHLNLHYMVRTIRERGCRPILCNLQPICNRKYYDQFPQILQYQYFTGMPLDWQNGYSEVVRRTALELEVDFIDIRSELLMEIDRVICADGFHPNDYGHRRIAEIIHRELAVILKPSSRKRPPSHRLALLKAGLQAAAR